MWPVIADGWAYAALAVVLVAASVTDIRAGKIYNSITYPAIAVGLIGHTFVGGLAGTGHSPGLVGALAGLAVGFGPLLVAWLAGGIGGGDAKLMAAVGALTGWEFTLTAMFYGFAVAAMMGFYWKLVFHRSRKQEYRDFTQLNLRNFWLCWQVTDPKIFKKKKERIRRYFFF